ncbi:hypothetical protein R5R35_010772 [Gryllus longicercus]|uniref:Cytochrome P450 n=1 Tax=Gryllus longicercus TaxID=2509291 RepID=A0AAN9VDX0_9ORTH
MKYLDAVISEVLRLYPPAPSTDRICVKDTLLPAGEYSNAITIPKGTIVQAPIVGLHTDPQYWKEPKKFDPDRFSDENKHKIKPFTYMPFGMGPRICIGQRFALIEVKMALVHLLHSFDLHPSAKTKFPIEYQTGANLLAKGGFWCGLTPRRV